MRNAYGVENHERAGNTTEDSPMKWRQCLGASRRKKGRGERAMVRRYFLGGQQIDSSKVNGFLHRARKSRYNCAGCRKRISARQEYVRLNTFGEMKLHKDCYVSDHEKSILVTRRGTRYFTGVKVLCLFCEEFGRGVSSDV